MGKKPAVIKGTATFYLKSGDKIVLNTTKEHADAHIDGMQGSYGVRMERNDGGFTFLRYDDLSAFTFAPEE